MAACREGDRWIVCGSALGGGAAVKKRTLEDIRAADAARQKRYRERLKAERKEGHGTEKRRTIADIAAANAARQKRYRERHRAVQERPGEHGRVLRFCRRCAERGVGLHIPGIVGPEEYGWKYREEFEGARGGGLLRLCWECTQVVKEEKEQVRASLRLRGNE